MENQPFNYQKTVQRYEKRWNNRRLKKKKDERRRFKDECLESGVIHEILHKCVRHKVCRL